MRSLTEILRDLRNMIVESISYEPCSVAELKKRDFLKTTSSYGTEFCIRDLIQEKRLFEKIKDGEEILCAYDSLLNKEDLLVNHLYKSKRRATTQLSSGAIVYADRRITSVNGYYIQYDSPLILTGQERPTVTVNEFLNWVKADVTDEAIYQWIEKIRSIS